MAARLLCTSMLVFTLATAAGRATESVQAPSPSLMVVTVELHRGRSLAGHVDFRTDEHNLWLRVTRGQASLTSSFSWETVRTVHVGPDRFSGSEFRQMASHFASRLPRSVTWSGVQEPGESSTAIKHPSTASPVPRVQSLTVQVDLSNWDRDAEVDGLEVRLSARTASEASIPVAGVFSAELIAITTGPHPSSDPAVWSREKRASPLTTLDRWTIRLGREDFSSSGEATVRLPFHFVNPDEVLSLSSTGLFRAEINVPGQGTFSAETAVRIRSYNPVRDSRLEYQRHHDAFGRHRGRHW